MFEFICTEKQENQSSAGSGPIQIRSTFTKGSCREPQKRGAIQKGSLSLNILSPDAKIKKMALPLVQSTAAVLKACHHPTKPWPPRSIIHPVAATPTTPAGLG